MRFLFLISFAILTACQTNPVRHFDEKVKVGLEKSQVLDIMGTPWATTRFHGKDRWIYVIYDDGIRKEREVHFENGAAVYVGDAYKPAPEKTAEAKDKQVEELNKKIDEEEAQTKKVNQEAFSNFEKEAKGEGTKVKYLPDYAEIE